MVNFTTSCPVVGLQLIRWVRSVVTLSILWKVKTLSWKALPVPASNSHPLESFIFKTIS